MVIIITITISFDTVTISNFHHALIDKCIKNNSRQFFGDPIECDAGAVRDFFSHFLFFSSFLSNRQTLQLNKMSWILIVGCIQPGTYQGCCP